MKYQNERRLFCTVFLFYLYFIFVYAIFITHDTFTFTIKLFHITNNTHSFSNELSQSNTVFAQQFVYFKTVTITFFVNDHGGEI